MRKSSSRIGARVLARLARHLEVALARVEVTPAQYRMLVQLDEGPEVASGLAAKLAVSPPSVTNVVDGLVQRGLVERTHAEVDRRKVALALTPAGAVLLAEADDAVAHQLTQLLSSTGDEALLVELGAFAPALNEHRSRRRSEVGATPPGVIRL